LIVVGLGAVCFTAAAHNDVAQVVGEAAQKTVLAKKIESYEIPLVSAPVVLQVSDEIKLENAIAKSMDKVIEKPIKSEVDTPFSNSTLPANNVTSVEEANVGDADQKSKTTESKVEDGKQYEYVEMSSARVDFTQATCKPAYRKSSIRNEETGTTTLKAYVNKEGGIDKVQILKSSGFRNLDVAVYEKLLDPVCKAQPAKLNGEVVGSVITIEYTWTLH
jgi:TonB family protein